MRISAIEGISMSLPFAASIVAGCLLSIAQLAVPFSFAMAADSFFSQPKITSAIDETKLFQLKNNVVKAVITANDRGAIADDFPP